MTVAMCVSKSTMDFTLDLISITVKIDHPCLLGNGSDNLTVGFHGRNLDTINNHIHILHDKSPG